MFVRGFQWLGWLAYLAGCLLILQNTIADYLLGETSLFIADNGPIGPSALWRTSLYLHIFGGLTCAFAALPQFSRKLIRCFPAIHRHAGRIYGTCVLVLVCPTGFHLALFSKGGFLGKLGFLTLAVATFQTTLNGCRAVLPPVPDMVAHRAWMIRSFALVASAVSFRIYHILGHLAGLEPAANYVICLWLSLLGNAAVAEIIIRRPRPAPSLPLQLHTEP